jgi:hypothetical protein
MSSGIGPPATEEVKRESAVEENQTGGCVQEMDSAQICSKSADRFFVSPRCAIIFCDEQDAGPGG